MEQSELRMRYHAASDLVRQGKCVEAMAILDALDQAFPNSREIMWARAQCLKRLERLDEANGVCVRWAPCLTTSCHRHEAGPVPPGMPQASAFRP